MRAHHHRLLALAAVAAALAIAGCGNGAENVGNPDSEVSIAEAEAPLRDAPPALSSLRSEANQLLDGDINDLNARLDDLEGTPVVINIWASWCGPCRHEFPFFQSQAIELGDRIAFLGVNTRDAEDAAKTFLSELPLPYPSYFDPDGELADELDAGPGLPNTIFIGSDGEVAYHQRGGYATEEELAEQIARYAR